jgi:copper/silver efflux system protein
MIDRVIELSLRNKFLVVMLWIGIAGWGLWAMLRAPIDAIPDFANFTIGRMTLHSGR